MSLEYHEICLDVAKKKASQKAMNDTYKWPNRRVNVYINVVLKTL